MIIAITIEQFHATADQMQEQWIKPTLTEVRWAAAHLQPSVRR